MSVPSVDGGPGTGIEVRNLRKEYTVSSGAKLTVFDGLSFSVRHREYVTLFGPNGCGKSTLLRILAGILPWDFGSVSISGDVPGSSKVGFVFQDVKASLLPWRSVLDNVTWPLELEGIDRDSRKRIAQEFLRHIAMDLPLERYPYELSGGQQQLVSIARALVFEPNVLFMDEPFSQLDYQTRLTLQIQAQSIWSRSEATVFFVSHDLEEALFLGHRIVLLGKSPEGVRAILENNAPFPRNHALLTAPEFLQLKAEALRLVLTP